jgi:hypothetical protein
MATIRIVLAVVFIICSVVSIIISAKENNEPSVLGWSCALMWCLMYIMTIIEKRSL